MSTSEPRRRPGGAAGVVEVEHDTLALAQHAEDRTAQRIGGEFVVVEIGVGHHEPVTGAGS